MSTLQKRVWDDLSKIDCSAFTEQKMGLTYLSWAHAYSILMDRWPNNTYYFNTESYPDGTMMVECTLIIVEGDESAMRQMWLPVMDHRNKAVENPNSFQVNTAKMRALTKCLSMHGLGAYIYKGEDLPAETTASDAEVEEIQGLIEESKADMDKFLKAYKVSGLEMLTAKQVEMAREQLQRKIAKLAESDSE